jgi:hypothetical protein
MNKHLTFYLLAFLVFGGCGAAEPELDTEEPATVTAEQAVEQLPRSACVPSMDRSYNDDVASHDADFFGGFSQNVLRGPRDCGGQRLSRDVTKVAGTGWCAAVANGGLLWANEVCAFDPNLVVGNSTIADACQRFRQTGSDLGDHDCRYIVHMGAGPSFEGLQCQPSHVTRIAAYCPPRPPMCPSGFKCCELSDDHTSCDLCVRTGLFCP